MASAIYILSEKGQQLVGRDFRGDLPPRVTEKFIARVRDEEEQTSLKPVFEIDGVSYIYLMHHSLYVVAITNINADASLILMFLHELLKVFTGYFGKLEEENIRDNFVVIHELLDEMLDFGYPQVTNTKLLQEFIKTEHHQADMAKARPPPELTKNTGRPAGIVYQKNEAFLDVVEKVNLLVNQNGTLLKSEIEGQIRMKCFLSGMPEVRLGLNDRVLFGKVSNEDDNKDGQPRRRGDQRPIELEDVSFHGCVRLSEFDTDKTISFVPPDGAFTLMSYRINTRVKPLIWVEAHLQEFAGSRLEITVKARAQFNPRSTANEVQILVPVPNDVHTPKFKSGIGAYAPEVNSIVWKIKQFQGGKEYLMQAHFGLSTITQKQETEARHQPPISVKFEVPYFTVSGIQVKFLKIVEKTGYQALPWVRYLTQSGSFFVEFGSAPMGVATVVKAAVCLVLYVVILSLSIVLFAVGVAMLPLKLLMSPRSFTRLYLYIADYYWKFAVWFGEFVGIQFTLYGDNVPMRENAFVISNHRWGVDFIVYWMLAARKGRLGCLKLLAKDWLKFFPGFGWGGYLLDFVFLKRDWLHDQNTIRDTFHRLKTRDLPFWLLSHVEGTRLTPAKLEESKKFAAERGLPIMEETLLPRVKGFVSVIQELRDMKTPLVLYDTTLMYVDAVTGKTELPSGHPVPGPSTFSLFFRPSSHIHLHVKRYTMDQLPLTNAGLEQWLIEAFVRKQKLLADFRITHKFPDLCPQPMTFPSMDIAP